MPLPYTRAARYARAWLGRPVRLVEREIALEAGGATVPATVVHPASARAPMPGWVVLHGMTRLGRAHAQLQRFTGALVSSGVVAIVPEIPEWRDLRLAPHAASVAVRAAIRSLREGGWSDDRGVAVIGFSFGAPHGIAAASEPDLRSAIRGCTGFGGYADIESTFRFMMTGASDRGGAPGRLPPDPYGRWIVGANYLTAVPGLEDRADVAETLHELAIHSGEVGAPSWDEVYDPVIDRLRNELSPRAREVFDLFARPGGALPERAPAEQIAEALASAADRIDPLLDPRERLGRVGCPVQIVHGRGDRLISADEAPKLHAALPPTTPSRMTVTRLFGHSTQEPFSLLRSVKELPRFVRALEGVLELA